MRLSLRQLLLFLVAVGLLLPSVAAQEGPPAPGDRELIESRIASMLRAVELKDVDGVVAALTDSVVITAERRKITGRHKARQVLTFMLTRMVDVTFSMETVLLRVKDTSAFHTGDFSYTIEFPMGGELREDGTFVAEWVRLDDTDWRVSRIVATREVPQQPGE
jgi:ketosteroid isomerase-like protein